MLTYSRISVMLTYSRLSKMLTYSRLSVTGSTLDISPQIINAGEFYLSGLLKVYKLFFMSFSSIFPNFILEMCYNLLHDGQLLKSFCYTSKICRRNKVFLEAKIQ